MQGWISCHLGCFFLGAIDRISTQRQLCQAPRPRCKRDLLMDSPMNNLMHRWDLRWDAGDVDDVFGFRVSDSGAILEFVGWPFLSYQMTSKLERGPTVAIGYGGPKIFMPHVSMVKDHCFLWHILLHGKKQTETHIWHHIERLVSLHFWIRSWYTDTSRKAIRGNRVVLFFYIINY